MDLWIWADDAGEETVVRWSTPHGAGVVTEPPPLIHNNHTDTAELRDGYSQRPILEALPESLSTLILGAIDASSGPLRIHLARNLPAVWHKTPLEWYSYEGRSLASRLIVERYSPFPFDGCAPVAGARNLVLNLWPATESVQPCRKLSMRRDTDIEVGHREIASYLNTKDLTSSSVLCIVGHGSGKSDRPFLTEIGEPWALPDHKRLPPVVLLLLCGTDRGNLVDYGVSLLGRGARTVLAPVGSLDARSVEAFLGRFLDGWKEGERMDTLLRGAQDSPDARHGAFRLRLLGNGALRQTAAPAPFDLPTKLLRKAASLDSDRSANLIALVDRVTLRCLQREGTLGPAVCDLYRELGLEYDDPDLGPELFRGLDAVFGATWPLSQSWLAPFLGYLAEIHDHSAVAHYQAAASTYSAATPELPDSPLYFHYRAKTFYRQGCYARGIAELARGFEKIDPSHEQCSEGTIKLLGNLVNHLIDLALPNEAQTTITALQRCLAQFDGPTSATDRFKLMDRQGRVAMRLGGTDGLSSAITYFRMKREAARQRSQDGRRELTWLLYASAWRADPGARPFADEAKRILSRHRDVRARLGLGNSDDAYLMRALALWCWRGADHRAAALLEPYADIIEERAISQDPGPFAFTVAFLALYRGESSPASWARMKPALERDEYWLELTALSYLLRDRGRIAGFLSSFQSQRRTALNMLAKIPPWVAAGAFAPESWASINARVAEREGLEHVTLVENSAEPSVDRLVQTGLLPQ